MSRVIVAGGRDVRNRRIVEQAIASSPFRISELVHGMQRGVDTLAAEWAADNRVPVKAFNPLHYGTWPRCGPLRNRAMALYAAEKLPNAGCILIPTGGPGTRSMKRFAIALVLPTFEWDIGTGTGRLLNCKGECP